MYHNKFLIVDASNSCSDPMVLTGSHNWSFSADTKNDENTLIIHDDTAANIYYQSFHQNFSSMGGSLTNITDCVTGVVDNTNNTLIDVYPNPTTGVITVSSSLPFSLDTRLEIYNLSGQLLKQISGSEINGLKQKDISLYEHGVYLIRITDMQKSQTIMVLSK
jgi:phosphatidylserine/phosphatidylglycerophosphate/cardiolipin synthase-like enzyme